MKRAPRDRKSSGASALVVAGALGLAGFGCNIVQGFQDAGDSLFPEQSTHLAAPGLRLVSGSYRGLGFATSSSLYLLARVADDDTNKLVSMRYADPHPCELPGVARFNATRSLERGLPIFGYMNENVNEGKLRFADANCKTYDLTFDNARLPLDDTAKNIVVWAGSELWLATPETGERVRVLTDVQDVFGSVFGKRFGARTAGRLAILDNDWKLQGTFGDKVGNIQRLGKSVFYADSTGIRQITASQADANRVEDRLLVSDACSLGSQDGNWVTLRSPCSGGKVVAIHEPSGQRFTLPFDADPRQLKLVPGRNSPGKDPLKDPFWFFYLRSGESEEQMNTLYVRTPAGKELSLGPHATLQKLRLVESADETHGYALVNVVGETGRYLWWNPAGETRVLTESAMWRPNRLIVDFDGAIGKLAVASGDRMNVLAERVPWPAFEYQDSTRQWTVLFHDLDANNNGKLSAFGRGIDELQAIAPNQPFALPAFSDIATNVSALRTSSLNDVLSGVIYLADMDPATATGRLEYRNLELRFTARIADDVSDYLVAHDEVLYSIPYGANAGIWLVSGK